MECRGCWWGAGERQEVALRSPKIRMRPRSGAKYGDMKLPVCLMGLQEQQLEAEYQFTGVVWTFWAGGHMRWTQGAIPCSLRAELVARIIK